MPALNRTSTLAASRPARAKKALAQHFLVDRRVLARILEAAEVSPGDTVVEVGPGRGALTTGLAERAGRLVAVEVDEALAASLAERYRSNPRVEVVAADAREVALASLVAPGTPYKVVANLPYYAASPIVRRFLEAEHKPRLMVVMVQREVARRMTAEPGDMSILSVAVQVYGRPRTVCAVPPRAFRPAPKVSSSVVRIDVHDRLAVAFDSERHFFHLVRAGFSAPRKQLRNSLSAGLAILPGAAEELLSRAQIDATRRAETLSLGDWGRLYQAYREGAAPAG